MSRQFLLFQAGYSATANGSTGARTASVSVFGEMHQIIQSVTNPAEQFSDVPITHVFYSFVSMMRDQAITSGCGVNTYCPDLVTTRGQMAVFIIRALYGGDTFPFPATLYFTDVAANHPFFKWIQEDARTEHHCRLHHDQLLSE